MKVFGKELFKAKEPKVMYDFAQHGLLRDSDMNGEYMGLMTVSSSSTPTKKKKKNKPVVNPKKLFQMSALNNNNFSINAEESYLAQEISNAKKKLNLIYNNRNEEDSPYNIGIGGGAHYGKLELESIIERLNNRRRLSEFTEILEKYPHTSSQLINDVVNAHSNLRCQLASSFIPDMPSEAVEAMDEYNEMCVALTGKKTHFYVVADRKDFGERDRKRDPILLAQSPFGFFWQILGAWDEEMEYLGDL